MVSLLLLLLLLGAPPQVPSAANDAPSFSLPLSVDAITAFREAHEEVGLAPESLEVVAELPPLLSKHLLSVAVVVATLKEKPESVEIFLKSLQLSPTEVDAAFEAPMAAFLDPTASSATAPMSAAGIAVASRGPAAAAAAAAAAASSSSGSSSSSCSYSYRDARLGRVSAAPRFRHHFFDMRNRPCVSSEANEKGRGSGTSGGIIERGDFLVWGLTAGIVVGVAGAALGRPASFKVSSPRAAPYGRICCFRDRNGGMPTVAPARGMAAAAAGRKKRL